MPLPYEYTFATTRSHISTTLRVVVTSLWSEGTKHSLTGSTKYLLGKKYPQVPSQRGESLMEFNSREPLVSRSPDGGGLCKTWRVAENREQPTTLASREIAPFLSFQDSSILDAGKIHVRLLSWLAYLKGFCDWIRPECVLDVCGKWRQKGAQMEERQKNDEINKQIHSY